MALAKDYIGDKIHLIFVSIIVIIIYVLIYYIDKAESSKELFK